MLVIRTTVFFQCNNQRDISELCIESLSHRTKISLGCNISILELQFMKISSYFLPPIGSKKLKLYDTFKAKYFSNMNFW